MMSLSDFFLSRASSPQRLSSACFQVCLSPVAIPNAPRNLSPGELTLTEGHDLQTVNFSLRCRTFPPPPPLPQPPLYLLQVQEIWPLMGRSSA